MMNERIKELAEEAEKYADDNFRGEPTYSEAYDSKFAELIVKKCAYLVSDQQRTTGYTNHAQMLCKEFDIEFKEDDYFGVTND